ncbi:hypothetical protein P691DRAFT_847274 [Macrolepiota fuliginosa MF-IS2]|uniref:Uncharacterized protein n=1 Tax=Macrolepiota fuliginosa MF-IS2 TaxID=1400762 RepID=A0A9P6BX09_9AGAR|nr:hypothetical protein P691DRAFT_847274 [Macrolepiota fuliginosa MF-IS2]
MNAKAPYTHPRHTNCVAAHRTASKLTRLDVQPGFECKGNPQSCSVGSEFSEPFTVMNKSLRAYPSSQYRGNSMERMVLQRWQTFRRVWMSTGHVPAGAATVVLAVVFLTLVLVEIGGIKTVLS